MRVQARQALVPPARAVRPCYRGLGASGHTHGCPELYGWLTSRDVRGERLARSGPRLAILLHSFRLLGISLLDPTSTTYTELLFAYMCFILLQCFSNASHNAHITASEFFPINYCINCGECPPHNPHDFIVRYPLTP